MRLLWEDMAVFQSEKLTEKEVKQAVVLMSGAAMFRYCSEENLGMLARSMTRCRFARGDEIAIQASDATHMHLLSEGCATSSRKVDGVEHQLDTKDAGTIINSLHVLNRDPAFATVRCMDQQCVTYALPSEVLNQQLTANPAFAREVVVSLSKEVRQQTKTLRTPLFEQHPKPLKQLPIISVAAGIESYYRSALNSMVNARLTGQRGSLFPHMSVQVPTRVLYINGLKGIRQYLNSRFDPHQFAMPVVAGICISFIPGVVMTPVSSILEATNAGHYNNESLRTRWIRGIPRGVREIIFGIGLNQLSDYFEERANLVVSPSSHSAWANAIGSVNAGVVAGYLSHVPHNMSAYKLMNPKKSYSVLFREFVEISAPKYLIPAGMSPYIRPYYTAIVACVFPRGCVIRTAQIVGSFILLNGTINLLQRTQ